MNISRRSFLLRHKLISFLRDIDLRGFRRLSVILPKIVLPDPNKTGKHILKTLHGVELIIDPSADKGVELSLFETGTYEKGTIQLLGKFLKPDSTFIDIGANIGLMSAIASQLVGQKGKVLSVEANPGTVDLLRENLAINQCINTVVFPFALGSKPGEALLFENWHVNRGGASLLNQDRACDTKTNGIAVDVKTLDDVFSEEQPDLIKIDVEGFELEVLKGSAALLKAHLPVLIIEVSEERENEKSVSPKAIADFVRSLGNYTIFKQKGSKERRSKLIPVLSDEDLPHHDNIICIPLRRTNGLL